MKGYFIKLLAVFFFCTAIHAKFQDRTSLSNNSASVCRDFIPESLLPDIPFLEVNGICYIDEDVDLNKLRYDKQATAENAEKLPTADNAPLIIGLSRAYLVSKETMYNLARPNYTVSKQEANKGIKEIPICVKFHYEEQCGVKRVCNLVCLTAELAELRFKGLSGVIKMGTKFCKYFCDDIPDCRQVKVCDPGSPLSTDFIKPEEFVDASNHKDKPKKEPEISIKIPDMPDLSTILTPQKPKPVLRGPDIAPSPPPPPQFRSQPVRSQKKKHTKRQAEGAPKYSESKTETLRIK